MSELSMTSFFLGVISAVITVFLKGVFDAYFYKHKKCIDHQQNVAIMLEKEKIVACQELYSILATIVNDKMYSKKTYYDKLEVVYFKNIFYFDLHVKKEFNDLFKIGVERLHKKKVEKLMGSLSESKKNSVLLDVPSEISKDVLQSAGTKRMLFNHFESFFDRLYSFWAKLKSEIK